MHRHLAIVAWDVANPSPNSRINTCRVLMPAFRFAIGYRAHGRDFTAFTAIHCDFPYSCSRPIRFPDTTASRSTVHNVLVSRCLAWTACGLFSPLTRTWCSPPIGTGLVAQWRGLHILNTAQRDSQRRDIERDCWGDTGTSFSRISNPLRPSHASTLYRYASTFAWVQVRWSIRRCVPVLAVCCGQVSASLCSSR